MMSRLLVPGFSPDPSIALVGDTFFLVTSTFHIFPGLPIYASKDLSSFQLIGHAINRRSQLSLASSDTKIVDNDCGSSPMAATGGLYAPTIRYHDGITYVICTNVIHDESGDRHQNFLVWTTNPWSDLWSEPVLLDFEGIDPSIIWDAEGRSYIHYSAPPNPWNKITMLEANLMTGERLGDASVIWSGTGGKYPEGPHIYKKDGFYYLIISEGGTFEGHMVTAARSTHLFGPYEPCPRNPILTAKNTEEYVQHVGHSDIFQDLQGAWWAVCHGVRKKDGRYVMGRETFITRCNWKTGEWPEVHPISGIDQPKDSANTASGVNVSASNKTLDFVYLRDSNIDKFKISPDGKTISLRASQDDLSDATGNVFFVGKRQRNMKGFSSATLYDLQNPSMGSKVGLAYYKDEHRYSRMYYDYRNSKIVWETKSLATKLAEIKRIDVAANVERVGFCIHYSEQELRFSFSLESGATSEIGVLDSMVMTMPDFVGPLVGVFATGGGDDLVATFTDFLVE